MRSFWPLFFGWDAAHSKKECEVKLPLRSRGHFSTSSEVYTDLTEQISAIF